MVSLKNLFSKKSQGVGIEITANRINIVQLQSQKQGMQLKACSSLSLPEGTFQEGRILDPEVIADAIRQGLDDEKIRAQQVSSAVPIGEAVIRLIRLPAELDEMELRDMVLNQEAALYLPFPREEAYVDFQRLGTDIDEDGIERVEVLLVATPKETTDNYLHVFQLAGLQLNTLEVSSFALIRTLHNQLLQFVTGEASALVNIDFDSTEISIVMDGVPQFNRTVPLGTQHLQTALCRAMNLPNSMGSDLLQGMTVPSDLADGMGGADPNPSAAAILRTLGDLSDELRRSIDFYLNQGEDLEISQVFVAGPGAMLGQLDEFLTQRLGLTTTIVDPIETLGLTDFGDIPIPQRPTLGVAMGLGLREA